MKDQSWMTPINFVNLNSDQFHVCLSPPTPESSKWGNNNHTPEGKGREWNVGEREEFYKMVREKEKRENNKGRRVKQKQRN